MLLLRSLLVRHSGRVRLVAEAGRVMRELQLVHVDLESLGLVLQVQLQLGPDLLKMGELVPSVLAFVLLNWHHNYEVSPESYSIVQLPINDGWHKCKEFPVQFQQTGIRF